MSLAFYTCLKIENIFREAFCNHSQKDALVFGIFDENGFKQDTGLFYQTRGIETEVALFCGRLLSTIESMMA